MAIKPYTLDEIRGILAEAGIIYSTELIPAIAAAVNAEMVARGPSIVDHFMSGITGPTNESILDRARAQAERQTRKIFGDLAQTQANAVARVIEQGLREGKNPLAIANQLEAITGLDPQRASRYETYKQFLENSDLSDAEIEARLERFFGKELADRRRIIARTEQAFASAEGNRIIAEERGAQFKAWVTTGDDRVSDECQANEAEGWIKIEDEFPGGVQQEPQHPRCRCRVIYRTAPPSKEAQERAEARAERTEAAKEEAA